MSSFTYSALSFGHIVAGFGLVLFALTFVVAPTNASAAVYGYVDAQGEVKSVTASDWMTAIATAPNINIHSGVMVLSSAADYAVVGDMVEGAK